MGGRQAVPRTRFARVACSDPGISVFRISGSLGPRAKPYLARMTQECLRRNLPRVVLDLSEVDALGGGTARLLNEFAASRAARGGKTAFRVTSRTVRGFLTADPSLPPPLLAASLEEAVAGVRGHDAARHDKLLFVDEGANSAPTGEWDATSAEPLVLLPGPEPGGPIALELQSDLEALFDYPPLAQAAGAATQAAPGQDAAAGAVSATIEKLTGALHERGIASRIFLFQLQPDGHYYLATRHGLDPDRVVAHDGALARRVRALQSPGFVLDLLHDGLSAEEDQLLTELNCEVTSPVWSSGGEFLLFVSKARPGDEYTVDELHALERVLRDGESARPATPKPAAARAAGARADLPEWSPWHAAVPAATPALVTAGVGVPSFAMAGPPAPANVQRTNPALPEPARALEAGWKRPGAAEPTDLRGMRRGMAQMRDILSLSHDFDASFGTSRILEALVLSLVSVARLDSVLYLVTREEEYRLTHHRGLTPELHGLRLRADSGLVQAALASQRGIDIWESPEIGTDEKLWARQHGLRFAVPFRIKEETLGLMLLGGSGESLPDLEMISFLLGQAGLAYDRARLYEMLQDRTLGVVRGLITLIESRNGFDCGSTEQVVRYTQSLARELQYPHESLRELVYGAVLRDVGMLQVSETVLRSAQDLTGDQWEVIRRHPVEGASIMRQMRFSDVAVDVVLHHHESYNGEGYPMGLRGRGIPIGARIVAVAESYVKMTMDRPYRKALGKAEALESLAENWGLRYDPLVVDALARVVNHELSMGLKGDRDLTRDLFGV